MGIAFVAPGRLRVTQGTLDGRQDCTRPTISGKRAMSRSAEVREPRRIVTSVAMPSLKASEVIASVPSAPGFDPPGRSLRQSHSVGGIDGSSRRSATADAALLRDQPRTTQRTSFRADSLSDATSRPSSLVPPWFMRQDAVPSGKGSISSSRPWTAHSSCTPPPETGAR